VRTAHGLVIGKFYPPHAGHHLLIRAAAAVCDRVTVVAMASSVESIPLADRVEWLREVHAADSHVHVVGTMDEHPVDYGDPHVWDLHQRLMEEAVCRVTHHPVTAVFTSEPYGDELARRFGAIPVAIDPERALVPCSGTAVRADPISCWEFLAAPVRRFLARRVTVIGAESTGTTTLSLQLADRLRARGGVHAATRWVPEYGREYTVEKLALERARAALQRRGFAGMDDLVWTSPEFEAIARRQIEMEDAAAAAGGPIVICDTDAFATAIWHERYLETRSAPVEALADAREHPLYLLTHHEGVPFVQDGIRDGYHVRAWMTDRFLEALRATDRRAVVLTGSLEERVEKALAAIDALLAAGWQLAPPLG
jgi:HTH-type transcriptional repressor of NAD biosynthesis genes